MARMTRDERKAFVARLFRQEWDQTRRKGRRRFVWILASIFGAGFGGGLVWKDIYKGEFSILIDCPFAIAALAGGYFVGTKAWAENEKRFLAGDQSVNLPPRIKTTRLNQTDPLPDVPQQS